MTSPYQQRYGQEDLPDNDYPVNEFIDNILQRSTCRYYTDQEIDPNLLNKLFAAAQSAPTSSMFQAWSAVVLDGEKKLNLFELPDAEHLGFSKGANKSTDPQNFASIKTCNKFIVWCVNMNTMKTIMEHCLHNEEYYLNYKDITNLIPLSLESLNYSTYQLRSICDSIIAAQTFCLSAESMGLGTMYCGSIKTMDLQEFLNLPPYVMPLFGICVGYPVKPKGLVKPRMPQELMIHYNTHKDPDIGKLEKYNVLLRNFYNKYNVSTSEFQSNDWFSRIIKRTKISEILKKYRKLIEKQGFLFW